MQCIAGVENDIQDRHVLLILLPLVYHRCHGQCPSLCWRYTYNTLKRVVHI